MKKISLLLFFSLLVPTFTISASAVAPISAYTAMEKHTFDTGNGTTMPYRLYIPENYDPNKQYPLLLCMHGHGEVGDDNSRQLSGTVQLLFQNHADNEQLMQSIILAPQCPTGQQWVNSPDWGTGNYSIDAIPEATSIKNALKILYDVMDRYSVDRDRVYVTGLSMGGFATWDLLMRHGEIFAAGAPICGAADPSQAENLKDIPIWTFHDVGDPVVPYAGTLEMYNTIKALDGNIRMTTYRFNDHNSWSPAYADKDLINWLYAQRLSNRTNPPVSDSADEPVVTTDDSCEALDDGALESSRPSVVKQIFSHVVAFMVGGMSFLNVYLLTRKKKSL